MVINFTDGGTGTSAETGTMVVLDSDEEEEADDSTMKSECCRFSVHCRCRVSLHGQQGIELQDHYHDRLIMFGTSNLLPLITTLLYH